MERREFVTFCCGGAALALAPEALLGATGEPRFYGRSKLMDEFGEPIKAKSLAVNRNYVFSYPYQGTPCFLLHLDKPTGREVRLETADKRAYVWSGGVGNDRAVVAYSAICAHHLAYPTKQVSFISFRDVPSQIYPRANVITCCAQQSVYDPAAGAKVLAGPAPQPLCAIILEHDAKADELYAVGTYGGELFNEFFTKYAFKLDLDHGKNVAQKRVEEKTVVAELTHYCRQQIQC
jgi:arsenite oxidase small subunit